eukprot:CAMPEP_0179997234 /NCGR_PEP_ID=MMETSP0984-20121128/8027_1 /TAXON_ID=483367 /ORGANISM="non described non described, Strain CCMP 2436" /LENGTH=210 /DNA_ID=CAMNT_0021916813 /DNA_START=372 /DNA_END=1001 /DNA_ORIENTATION=+
MGQVFAAHLGMLGCRGRPVESGADEAGKGMQLVVDSYPPRLRAAARSPLRYAFDAALRVHEAAVVRHLRTALGAVQHDIPPLLALDRLELHEHKLPATCVLPFGICHLRDVGLVELTAELAVAMLPDLKSIHVSSEPASRRASAFDLRSNTGVIADSARAPASAENAGSRPTPKVAAPAVARRASSISQIKRLLLCCPRCPTRLALCALP